MNESGHKRPHRARALRRVLRAGVFVVSGALIVSALVFSLARMALPMMTDYQQSLMAMMSDKWGKPVSFDHLDLSWSGYRPQLVIDDLRLTDGPRIHRLAISLAPWASLTRGRLSAGEIEVDQPSFSLELDQGGHWRLGGYEAGKNDGAGPFDLARLKSLLVLLGQVSVRQAQVRVVNPAGQVQHAVLNLAAKINSDHWSASGDIDIPGLMSRPARLRALGQFDKPVSATVFLNTRDWRLAKAQSLIRDYTVGETRAMLGGCSGAGSAAACLHGIPRIDSGRLSGSLWLQWQAGHLDSVHTVARVNQLAVTRLVRGEVPAARSGISHLSTRIAWQRMRNPSGVSGWRLDGDRLDVVTTSGDRWPRQSFHVIRHDGRTDFSAGFADLSQLAVWLSTAPLPPSYLKLLGSSEPRGQARDIRLHFDGDHLVRGYLQLRNFGNASGKHLWPVVGKSDGLGGINLTLYKQPEGWIASVDQHDLVLAIPGMFREPATIDRLAGDLYWQDRPSAIVWSDDLVLNNPDMRSRSRFLYRATSAEDGDQPLLQISTDFDDVPIQRVPAYLPRQLIGGGAIKWLDRALDDASGTAHDGRFVFNGDPSRFPFRHDEGVFSVSFDFNGLDLPYLKHWPDLQDAAGIMKFRNTGLSVQLRDGKVGGLNIGGGKLAIANFDQPRLKLAVKARNPLNAYLDFLGRSPILPSSLTGQFKGAGEADLDLDLLVPLDKSGQTGPNNGVVAQGTVSFDNDGLTWRGPPVRLQQLKGDLSFRNSDINAKGLKASFDGSSTAISISTPHGGKQTRLQAHLKLDPLFALRRKQDSGLAEWIKPLKGKSTTDVTVNIPHGGERFSLTASSDLAGMKSGLPVPFAKPADAKWPSQLKLDWRSGTLRRLQLNVDGGSAVKANVDYRANPSRGNPPLDLKLSGNRADWSRWSSLLLPGDGKGRAPGAWPDFNLQLTTRHLLAMDRDFGRTSVSARQHNAGDELEVGLDGMNLAGDIRIHPAGRQRSHTGIDASFQRLYLPEADEKPTAGKGKDTTAEPWALADLPTLSLRIANLRHGKTRLGRLALQAKPGNHAGAPAWLVDALKWQPNSSTTVSGKGRVQGKGRQQQTWLQLDGKGPDLGALLQQLFGSSPIKGGKITTANADLHNPGPPTAISDRTLSGSGRFVIEKGRVLDVDTGAVRLAGLLSLGALTRRLRLDFRDVVDNGLVFDSLAGKWRLGKGVLTFEPLELKNPSLAAIASGSSDLARQTMDYRVKVYADVGMLLPIIGTVAGGPVVGGAILALQQMMKSVDKNPSPTVIYRVTGTFDKPVVKEEKSTQKSGNAQGNVQNVP